MHPFVPRYQTHHISWGDIEIAQWEPNSILYGMFLQMKYWRHQDIEMSPVVRLIFLCADCQRGLHLYLFSCIEYQVAANHMYDSK